LKDYASIYLKFCLGIVFIIIAHQAILSVFQPNGFQDVVYYSIQQSYLLFIFTSFIFLKVNSILFKKKQEQLGFLFLIFSTLKSILIFGLLSSTFTGLENYINFERGQYLFLFVAFLALDVYQTSCFLRKSTSKQKNIDK
jgi:hypothetical protein